MSAECLLYSLSILQRNDDIQVIMGPRLPADQRVDSPAPIQPDPDAGCFQPADDLKNIARLHALCSLPYLSDAQSRELHYTGPFQTFDIGCHGTRKHRV